MLTWLTLGEVGAVAFMLGSFFGAWWNNRNATRFWSHQVDYWHNLYIETIQRDTERMQARTRAYLGLPDNPYEALADVTLRGCGTAHEGPCVNEHEPA